MNNVPKIKFYNKNFFNKRLIFFLIILLSLKDSYGQKEFEIDSLQKYSYQIYFYFKTGVPQHIGATCFFIKKENKTFLITANHIFSLLDIFNYGKNSLHKDTLFVGLYTDDKQDLELFPIDISCFLKTNKYNEDTLELKGDYVFYEISIPKKYSIYSVEKFIDSNYINLENPDSAIVYGYRTFGNDTGALEAPSIKSRCQVFGNIKNPIRFAYKNKNNFSSYYLFCKDMIVGGGFSGAPVFWIYNLNDNPFKKKIIFGGLLWGGYLQKPYNFVIRPDLIVHDLLGTPQMFIPRVGEPIQLTSSP